MATAMLPGASRVGTIDPMGKTRVYTDATLRVVPAGAPEAAFVWKRGDLERVKSRRSELGLDKNDEALRVQIDSQKVELAKAERKAALTQAELETLRALLQKAGMAEDSGSEPKKLTGKALDERVAELGLDLPANASADDKRAAVAEAEASE